MLDPELHSIAFVRSRSALLFTTLLALGSTALATLPKHADEQVSEALGLHAHVEKLNLVVYTTGARSIEIMQAQIVSRRIARHDNCTHQMGQSLKIPVAVSMGRISQNSA
jgi:rubrerythrin